ncbi:MAG: hypothetical protein ACFCUJ_03745 [Thiotrichales bacterium]
MFLNTPQIPLQVLQKMISELPPSELAKLPIEKLPRNIPLDFLANAPVESAATLETLLLQQQANSLEQRRTLRDVLGDEGLAAFDLAMHCALTGPVRDLNEKIHNHRKFKRTQTTQNSHRGALILLESLDGCLRLVHDVHAHRGRLLRARQTLNRCTVDESPMHDMLERAGEKLLNHARVHSEVLRLFQVERMEACAQVMSGYVKMIQQQSSRQESLHNRHDAMQLRLDELHTMLATARDRSSVLRQIDLVRTEIAKTSTALHSLASPLDESELTQWLDALIDFAITHPGKANTSNSYREGMVNFVVLLQHYHRAQQEIFAKNSQNPFLPIGTERMAAFAIRSETFLLTYFQTKAKDKLLGIHGNQSALEIIEQIQTDIMHRVQLRLIPELPKPN